MVWNLGVKFEGNHTSPVSSVILFCMVPAPSLVFAMPVILALQGYLAAVLYSFDYVLRCFGISFVETIDERDSSQVERISLS